MLAILLFGAADLAYSFLQLHHTAAMQDFVDAIPPTATRQDVLERAYAAEMLVLDDGQKSGAVTLMNHRAPYFRITCKAEFKNGKLVDKRFFDSD